MAERVDLLDDEPIDQGLMNDVIEVTADGEERPRQGISISTLLPVERGGPGSGHHGHEGRPGKRGGSQPSGGSGAIEVPRFKTKSEYIQYMADNFMERSEFPLGTLFITEGLTPESGKSSLDDYHELASALAALKERFPNLRVSRKYTDKETGEPAEDLLTWMIQHPKSSSGSQYDHHNFLLTINSMDNAGFAQKHIDTLERKLEEIRAIPFGDRRYQDKRGLARSEERLMMLQTPEGRREAHSTYWIENEDDQFSATVFHEFGHYIHRENQATWNEMLESDFGARADMQITARSRDSESELVAENFALWMMGHGRALDPRMSQAFKYLSEQAGG